MKVLHFLGNKQIQVKEVPLPALDEGRILVKVLASAVCGSERERYMGGPRQGFNGGHEAVGEVENPNGSKIWKKGDRVCVQVLNGCGNCLYCRKGQPSFCSELQYEEECHGQYVAMPEKCLVPMEKDIAPEIAVLLGGDLMGVAKRATRQLPIRKNQWVYVSGGGPIGLGVTFMLKALGARVILSEPHDFRRAFATEKAGADMVVNPEEQDVYAELLKLTDGIGPEITIECTGIPQVQTQALNWTRCQGHVMFCGENYKGLNIVPSDQIIHKELNVHGAFYFAATDVPEIIEMYRNGMDPSSLISHKVTLEDAPAVIEEFFEGRTGKVIILPNEA